MDKQNPCQQCHANNESYIGCHGKCEKYKKWKEEHDATRKTVYKEKERRLSLYTYKVSRINSTKRK